MFAKIIEFIKETWQRLKAESPTYFKVIQWISGAIAFITGIPALLAQCGVVLPPSLLKIENAVVSIAAIVGYFIAKLPVKDMSKITPPAITSDAGEPKKV